jgi:hypothetical protein
VGLLNGRGIITTFFTVDNQLQFIPTIYRFVIGSSREVLRLAVTLDYGMRTFCAPPS